MISSDDCRSYLKEICHRYEQWWAENALTEAIAARQATFSFEQMVQTEEKDSEGKPKKIILPIFKAIQDYIKSEHILLVGSPGVGKSTALLRCLVQLAEGEREKPEPRLPILVSMKKYKVSFSNSEDPSGMLTLIRNALPPKIRRKVSVSEVEELLFDNQFILLLDGLNEMSVDTIRTHLKTFREECQDSQVPLICTTRELGGGDLGIKRKLEIQPLRSEEVERLLQNCIPNQKQKVLQLLNRDNRALNRTPFVLWMLYDLFQKQGTEVETLAEAFRQFFQSFKKYKEDAPVTDERRQEWNRWLEYLAFTMLNNLDPTDPGLVIAKEQAEKILIEKFGGLYGASSRIEELLKYHLLESISEKEISFHHQLIQEYYAAEYLLTLLPDLLKKQPEQKYTSFQMNYLNYVKWTEAIALMLGLVEASKSHAKRLVELALDADLMLGARLAGAVKLQMQKQTIELINTVQSIDQIEPTNWLQVELLGRTQSKLALPKLQTLLRNSNLVIARRAAAWIGFLGFQEAIPDLLRMLSELDRWIPHKDGSRAYSDETLSLEIEIIEALEKISPKAAISKLREIFHNPASFFYLFNRSRINKLLKKFDTEVTTKESLETLRTSKDSSQISHASGLLFEIGCLDAPSVLISRLNCKQDVEVHKYLIDALAPFNTDEAIATLTNLILSEDSYLREKAAKALIEYERASAIDALIPHLDNSDWDIRWCTAVVLGKLGSDAATPILLDGLADQYPRNIRITAAEVLGKLGSDEVVRALISSLKDPDYGVRRSAAISLAYFNRQEAIPELLKALRHYYPSDDSHADIEIPFNLHEGYTHIIHGMTPEMLAQLGDDEAIWSWISETNNKRIREKVADALGDFDGSEIINGLFSSLRKGIKAAAIPLGRFGRQEVVPELLELLIKDNNAHVSSINKVIDTLVYLISLGNLSIVSELLSILTNIKDYPDADFYFRNRVAIILAKAEHEAMPSYLSKLTTLLPSEVGEQASWAIESIQSRCGFYNYEIYKQAQQAESLEPKDEQSKQEEYERILSILHQMALVMERDPETFSTIGEEALRSHFLVQLNGIYEGQATGETFNCQGKTDIIVKLQGDNVFIGECKFWSGENKLKETLDQLLGYATLRDKQLGMLIFNRNKNFSAVLEQIPAIIRNHSSFLEEANHSETEFRFILKHPNDPRCKLNLAILAFDIPSSSK
ncbi:MAG: HEAT repeat domain-containing protein [Leptolyngbya sp. IPPAS B-1204]